MHGLEIRTRIKEITWLPGIDAFKSGPSGNQVNRGSDRRVSTMIDASSPSARERDWDEAHSFT